MKKYSSAEDFIEKQEELYKDLLYQIRRVLLNAHPKMQEKISFNTVFFKVKFDICYFGIMKKSKGIEISFLRGYQLSNEQGLLDSKGRTIISGITFKDISDFKQKEKQFKEIIQEALILDEMHDKHVFTEVLKKKTK